MNFIKTIDNFFSNLTSEKVIQFIFEPEFTGWLLYLKLSFLIVSLVFLAFIIFILFNETIFPLFKTSWLKKLIIIDWKEFFSYWPYEKSKIEKKWQRIKMRLETDIVSEWKLAVIEADNLIDDVLSRMSFRGKDLDERLDKLISDFLPSIKEVKRAHLIRNNIVQDPNYKLTLEEAREILEIFDKALNELGAL